MPRTVQTARRGRGRGARYRYPDYDAPGVWKDDEWDDEEEIDPKAYYACVDQVWDQYTLGNWLTRKLKPSTTQKNTGRLIFKACNRVYGVFGPSTDDYTWIDFKSQSLVNFLRSEECLKGADGLVQSQPGIDARDLFLRLPRLKELVVEPTLKEGEPLMSMPKPEAPKSKPATPVIGELKLEDMPSLVPAVPKHGAIDPEAEQDEEEEAGSDQEKPSTPAVPAESPLSAPEQLWILVKFVEEHFRETLEELERLREDGYMSFKLLWTLCAPGSVVEIEDEATEYPAGVRVESWGYGSDGKAFNMQGVKYVWNGKVFKQNHVSVDVKSFKGLMKVSLVPIKVLSDHVRRQLIDRGKLYEKFAGVHHLKYNAFITVKTQQGYTRRPAKGRIMVDAAGFYRFNANAAGGPTGMGGYAYPPPMPMHQYTPPPVQSRLNVEEYQPSEPLPDEILCLVPPAHFGWSFTAKIWGLVLVENMADIVFDEMAFDQLVLKKEYKKMIKALVETHAAQGDGFVKDLVAGKGGGMVMVLHGKPGTGKVISSVYITEAISEHLKCPLYVVSSGELGIQAAQLERQLNDILEMTAAWKAVVLIDEADVFLEARNTHDLTRNSLVSVFLRLLEYHTGVLILTTNRIRSFDKAFVSRFSIALHYPDLDQNSRLLIWKEFLNRAGVQVGEMKDNALSRPQFIAYSDLLTLAKKSFNGRVIKQLVRGAQALALAEKEPLEFSHIITVLGITEQFEADWKELEFTDDVKGSGVNQDASMYS
ncbi:AAA family ATPase [Ceratobasidium sp. AG-Ba]|nr:AAA family ATPase [Ceratobasidium sp. AG-Ba]